MAASPRFQAVAEADLDAMLKQPFNPPVFTEAFTENDFREEHWTAQMAVAESLANLGTQDQLGGGDFCMNDDWSHSRFMAVELSSRCLWRPELISGVQSALQAQPEVYVVFFEHELPDERKFYFLVQPTGVIGFVPSAAHRAAFGF